MLTLFTGGTGTGKTAHMVALLEAEIKSGRTVFTNISGLKLPHYRIGNMADWQKGTWLHIDRYKRLSASIAVEEDNLDALANWEPLDDVRLDESTQKLRRIALDPTGQPVGHVPYETHKGALIVIDEAQNHFRPRPQGSAVPDCVAAFEVHRHQGLDFWLCTQRPTQIDSNVRGLCLRHIALRQSWQGRHSYEWPEVNDIDSKAMRDLAAKKRYTLPKHVFGLYRSADVHTEVKHSLPTSAKMAFLLVPLAVVMLFLVYNIVQRKMHPQSAATAMTAQADKFSMPAESTATETANTNIPESVAPESVPVVVDHPESAPMYSGIRQAQNLPWPDACIISNTACKCYTKHGEYLPEVGLDRCAELVDAKEFNPYENHQNETIQNQSSKPEKPQQVAQSDTNDDYRFRPPPLIVHASSSK